MKRPPSVLAVIPAKAAGIKIGIAAILLFIFATTSPLFATIFGSVRGVVHDPQHRPVEGAQVALKAQNLDWHQSRESNDSGGFDFSSVPIGNYTVTVSSKGFQQMQQKLEHGRLHPSGGLPRN